MRKTIDLSADAHGILKAHAKTRGMMMSAALNEMILRVANSPEFRDLKKDERGHLILSRPRDVCTPETMKEVSEDELV